MAAKIAGFLFRHATVWLLVGVAAVCGAYHVVKPAAPTLTARQHAMADELARQVTAWLGGLEPVRQPTAFLTLGRDRFGAVSDRLRSVLWQSDRFDLVDRALGEKLAQRLAWRRPAVDTRADAVERARSLGCVYALWGRVGEFSDLGDAARLAVDVELVRTATGERVLARSFDVRRGAAPRAPAAASPPASRAPGVCSLPRRPLPWAAATLALPLLTCPLARRVLRAERHGATLALLTGYVLASVVLAYGLVAWGETGWLAGLVLLAAFGLALLYDWQALSTIEALNH